MSGDSHPECTCSSTGPLEDHERWSGHWSGNEGRAADKSVSARSLETLEPILDPRTSAYMLSIRGHAPPSPSKVGWPPVLFPMALHFHMFKQGAVSIIVYICG